MSVNTKRSFLPRVPAISWWALLLLWLIFAIDALGRQLFFLVEPGIVKTYHLSAGMTGDIGAAVIASTGVLGIWGMSWSDRGGKGWARKYRHFLIIIIYSLFAVLTGIHFLTLTLAGFLVLGIMNHLAGGIGEGIEVTSVSEWWPEEARGFALGAHHSGYPWGGLLGGLLIAATLPMFNNDWRMEFILVPLLIVPVAVIYWFFARPNVFEKYQKQAVAMGLNPTVEVEETTQVNKKGAIIECLKNPNILFSAICGFLALVIYVSLSFWLTPYLAFVAKYDFAQAAGWSVVFTITGGIGQWFWGRVSDRIGRKRVMLICFGWLAVALYFFRYSADGLTALIVVQLFAGCVTNGVFNVIFALASDSAKKGYIGTAIGIADSGMWLGGVGILAIGWFISLGGGWTSKSGYFAGLWFMIACALLGFVLTIFFTRETVGAKRGRDFSLVSKESCNIAG